MIREVRTGPGPGDSVIAVWEAGRQAVPPDVTPLSLGVETCGGVMTRVVQRGTAIPTRRCATLSTAVDHQWAVDVVVLQGEHERAGENRVVGRLRLAGIRAARRGYPRIEVTFDIDADGVVEVGARDRDTGAEQRMTISESWNLGLREIERIIVEAGRSRAADTVGRRDG